jgi:prepilin-type N-terminal cleavage/methylation domain-containing protein
MKGFTMIEIMISLAILALIVGVSAISFANFSRKSALDASATALATALREARAKTLASVGSDQYGVKVDGDRFTLFRGASFSSSTPGNSEFLFAGQVRASSSPNVFVFRKVTGNAGSSGMIELYLTGSPTTKKTIQVEPTGLANIQ